MTEPDPVFSDPVSVHEHLLEITRAAYFSGDEDAFVARFLLPQRVYTTAGDVTMTRPEDVSNLFHSQRARFLKLGVTDLVRVSISAEFLDEDTVKGTHVSYMLRDRLLLMQPYPNTGILRRVGGLWKVADTQYGGQDEVWQELADALSHPPQYDPPRTEDPVRGPET